MCVTQFVLQLSEESAKALRELARRRGVAPEEVAAEAVEAYTEAAEPPKEVLRTFALAGIVEGDGTSVADLSDAELLEGFGEA